jgi:DNA-damage-inducible protein J
MEVKMSKTEIIRARIEPDLKHDAEEIFKKLGLSSSQAIVLFYQQVITSRGLPFDLKIPNETTQNAIIDSLLNRNLKKYSSLDELKEKYS